MNAGRSENRAARWVMVIGAGVYILLTYGLVFFGTQNVDEGYYHLIARQTARGDLPYRDYIYVQTPLYPLVYGAAFALFGDSFAFARGLSGFLGLIAFLLCVLTARRIGGDSAGAATAALIVSQPFTLYFLMIVKLYALAGLSVTAAIWFLCSRFSPLTRYTAASICLALGAATRLTLAPAVPLVIILAAIRTRRPFVVIAATLSATFVLGILILPFYLLTPDVFIYDVFTYHLEKEDFSLIRQISHRLDTLFQLSNLYFFPLTILTGAILLRIRRSWRRDAGMPRMLAGEGDAAVLLAGVIAFHFTAQAPYIYRYLAMLAPPLMTLVGVEAVRIRNRLPEPLGKGMVWLFFGACLLTLIARGRADFSFIDGGAFVQLKRVSAQVQAVSPPDKPILTFNNSVAVEAEREVVRGDEMNVLTYDPAWPRERCEKFVILNQDMLESLIRDRTFGAILVTRYSFLGNFPRFFNPGETGARPGVMRAIEHSYSKLTVFRSFGYLGENADLYIPTRTRSRDADRPGEITFAPDGESIPVGPEAQERQAGHDE